MALFIRQDEERSKLQERLATELQERAKQRAKQAEQPDGVDDSQFVKDTKMTSRLGWIWIVIGLLAVVAIVWLTVLSMTR
ncbi:MAG TPA: hypothetical protein VFS65_01830 [Candidatus Saccharimonadales bacterium]|nr:hypothetical protein [Candidatus Saccharimonadales bacterium]